MRRGEPQIQQIHRIVFRDCSRVLNWLAGLRQSSSLSLLQYHFRIKAIFCHQSTYRVLFDHILSPKVKTCFNQAPFFIINFLLNNRQAKPRNAAYVALCISHVYDMHLVEISHTLIAHVKSYLKFPF